MSLYFKRYYVTKESVLSHIAYISVHHIGKSDKRYNKLHMRRYMKIIIFKQILIWELETVAGYFF